MQKTTVTEELAKAKYMSRNPVETESSSKNLPLQEAVSLSPTSPLTSLFEVSNVYVICPKSIYIKTCIYSCLCVMSSFCDKNS